MRRHQPPVKRALRRQFTVTCHQFSIHEVQLIGGVYRHPRSPKMRPRIRRRET